MSIRHTAVSYYGLNYVEHAERDFAEIAGHGCDTVILAITEFDMDFWFPNLNEIIRAAHRAGLRAVADLWGIGKFFGGENVSLFLQNNIHNRQVSALTGQVLNAACISTLSFREYFFGLCKKIASETEIDGFFWDEPHYAMPAPSETSLTGTSNDWSCRCPVCMKKFKDEYGYEMPVYMNDDIRSFRRREALSILSDASEMIKKINPSIEITCCVLATRSTYYIREDCGYDDWDMVASCPYFDVFATTILDWNLPDTIFRDITERTVRTAKKYGKESERWILGYYSQPEHFERIEEIVDLYEKMGVDRLAAWTYRGGFGTNLSSKDPIGLWDEIGRNFSRVLKPKN